MALPRRLSLSGQYFVNFATMMFVGTTLFLAYTGQHFPALLSLKGVVFIVAGMLVAGLLIGTPLTKLHRHYSMGLLEKDQGEQNESTMKKVRFTGTFIMLLQLLVVYYLTVYLFAGWVLN